MNAFFYYLIIAILSYIPIIYIQKRISKSEKNKPIKTIGNYLFLFVLQFLMILIHAYFLVQSSSQGGEAAGWLVIFFMFMSPIFLIANLIVIFLINKRYTKTHSRFSG